MKTFKFILKVIILIALFPITLILSGIPFMLSYLIRLIEKIDEVSLPSETLERAGFWWIKSINKLVNKVFKKR